MQLASITGVVGVSFVVTFLASIVNYIWEDGIKKSTLITGITYAVVVVVITGVGMANVNKVKITTLDKTMRVATAVDDMGSHIVEFREDLEGFINLSHDIVSKRAKEAASNGSSVLVFPEDAFFSSEIYADEIIENVKKIAKENNINILFPLLRLPDEGKSRNTLNFISREGELLNTYTKNHLVPVVEEPTSERGDGNTPIVEVDGVKITYLICADYTSNKYAYNGREADILLNPSYD